MSLRILICHELPIVRDGLSTTLNAESDIEVVGATDSGIHAILLARTARPDVIVTGLTLYGISGLELIKRMGQERISPQPKVVVFAMNHSDQMITDVLHAGADGLLVKEATADELSAAIRAAARGQIMLAPLVANRLVSWFRRQDSQPEEQLRPALAALTPRERQVLLLIAQGKSTEEVADELAIGVTTVRTHVYRLRCKLDVKDRAQMVSVAYRSGMMVAS
ncbi:MAG TPA: response regulator transcription factor [Jatrophihabitans sp.]|uniref:response regulator n=1 Tax=Jatrophihabitans sp. TaxID=1932789 RepID=UPI002F1895A4